MQVYFYHYKLEFNSPLIVTTNAGDPNSSATLNHIPGSSLRGALAAAIQSEHRQDQAIAQAKISDLVLNDNIHFLPAYCEVKAGNNKGARGYPVPLFIKQKKFTDDKTKYNDLFYYECNSDSPPDSLKSVTGYINIGVSDTRISCPTSSVKVHHRRDRSKGHATDDSGDLFSYDSIDSGHNYHGCIRVIAQDDKEASDKIAEIKMFLGNRIHIGRSRRAGYGGSGTISDFEQKQRETATNGEQIAVLNKDLVAGDWFRVYLSSPCIAVNPETGMEDSDEVKLLLCENLGNRAKVVAEMSACEAVGSYNRKWKSETFQSYSLVAGSSFLMRVEKDIPKSDWLEIEKHGLGLRKNEGFGSIVFLKHTASECLTINEAGKRAAQKPEIAVPPSVINIENKIVDQVLNACIDKLICQILSRSRNATLPPGNLLGRFRNLFYRSDNVFSTLLDWLGDDSSRNLKSTAKKHLQKCLLTMQGNKKVNLIQILEDLAHSNGRLIFTQDFFRPLSSYTITGRDIDITFFSSTQQEMFRIAFARKLFNAMSLINRRKENA